MEGEPKRGVEVCRAGERRKGSRSERGEKSDCWWKIRVDGECRHSQGARGKRKMHYKKLGVLQVQITREKKDVLLSVNRTYRVPAVTAAIKSKRKSSTGFVTYEEEG